MARSTDSFAAAEEYSLTAGPDGPILLHDHRLIEQLARFNRERIPERQPHAKGGGAYGTFRVTGTVAGLTKAAVFQPGAATRAIVRFSSVAGERGSPDTWRDPRGFAVRLYTTEGNLDIVGNNTPVFFVRDPMKFPHLIRSQKRLAGSNLRDPDMQWDFWTLSPETSHQVTWLFGDRGIPATWRQMHGYGGHTFSWVNAAGGRFWVKYHFRCDQEIAWLSQADADTLAGRDADHHQRDLYEAIERGEFPSWTLHVQAMPFEDARTCEYNPFDLTKVWPQGRYPLKPVGTLTLNRNVTDYHSEIEQAAFQPDNLVPGTGLSPDRMLLARTFAYADAHRARLGVNYRQLPVNRSRGPADSFSRDGAMRYDLAPDPVYAPNSLDVPVSPATPDDDGWGYAVRGRMTRVAVPQRADDDVRQANDLINNVMADDERERLVHNVATSLSTVRSDEIRERAFRYWRAIDEPIGKRIEAAVRS